MPRLTAGGLAAGAAAAGTAGAAAAGTMAATAAAAASGGAAQDADDELAHRDSDVAEPLDNRLVVDGHALRLREDVLANQVEGRLAHGDRRLGELMEEDNRCIAVAVIVMSEVEK